MSTTQPASFQSIQVCALRATRLAADGTPLTGTTDGYLSKAPVLVTLSPDYEAGDELTIKNGCGVLGAYYKSPDQLKKYNITFELTDLDAELIEILTDEPIVSVGGATVGKTALRVATCSPATRNGVAIEFWSKKWDACTIPSDDELYWHWFMPWAFLATGEYSMQNDFMHIPVNGYLQENANFGRGAWSEGRWPEVGGLDSSWGVVSEDFFPTAASGYTAVS